MIDRENAEKLNEQRSLSVHEITMTVEFLLFTVKFRQAMKPLHNMTDVAKEMLNAVDKPEDLSTSHGMMVQGIVDIAERYGELQSKTSAFALLLQHMREVDNHDNVDEMFEAIIKKEGLEL